MTVTYAQRSDVRLLAPNGAPSLLSPKLWALVRTEQFKAWFGDWEREPESASKMLDRNGEPRVFYHGSAKAGFVEFETRGEGKTEGAGAFFTSDFAMARGYANGARASAPVFTPQELFDNPDLVEGLEITQGLVVGSGASGRSWQWFRDERELIEELGVEAVSQAAQGWLMVDPDGYECCGPKEVILDELANVREEGPGVYEVFLNVRDLLHVDWQDKNWDDPPVTDRWQILDVEGDVYDVAYSQQEAEELLREACQRHACELRLHHVQEPDYWSTDDAARQGRQMGFDGVLICNVWDTGPKGTSDCGDVVVVYEPANIKLTSNLGSFDPKAADVRFSRVTGATAIGGNGGMNVRDLAQWLAGLRLRWPQMPEVHVVADDDALSALLARAPSDGGAEGAVSEGVIYLVAANLRDIRHAERVLLEHEVAHLGLRALFGPNLPYVLASARRVSDHIAGRALELQRTEGMTLDEATEEAIIEMPQALGKVVSFWRFALHACAAFLQRRGLHKTSNALRMACVMGADVQQRAAVAVVDLVEASRQAGMRWKCVSDDVMADADTECHVPAAH